MSVATRFQDRFPGFSLRPRRLLWGFAAGVPILALAALNTGNNALYLLLSTALGVFVAAGALSRHTLARLRLGVRVPAETFAGSPTRIAVTVENRSGWLPAAGVVCAVEGGAERVLVPTVPPGGAVTVTASCIFPRRGLRRPPRVRAEVRLPLGFFVKSIAAGSGDDVLVFPRRFPGAAPRWGRAGRDTAAESAGGPRRSGGEPHQLRDFLPGDDIRDVHWKQTARQQRLVVVERREREVSSRYLVLDRELRGAATEATLERFEDLVSEVATAALAHLRRGEPVGLVVGSAVVAPAAGSEHARHLLRMLALVEPAAPGADPLPAMLGSGSVYRLAEGA